MLVLRILLIPAYMSQAGKLGLRFTDSNALRVILTGALVGAFLCELGGGVKLLITAYKGRKKKDS